MEFDPKSMDNPISVLDQYNRTRLVRMYNLAPTAIAKKECPGFIEKYKIQNLPE